MNLDSQTALRMMTNLLELRRKKGLDVPADPVSFFGFSPQDIACVHFWKQNQEGIWFRLRDNRVVNAEGGFSETDVSLYGLPSSPQPLIL